MWGSSQNQNALLWANANEVLIKENDYRYNFKVISNISFNINNYLSIRQMENQSSIDQNSVTHSCIFCAEKDQIIKKYQKLVLLLKKKVRRCSSLAFNNVNSLSAAEHVNKLKQITESFLNSKNSEFLPDVHEKSDNQCSTISPDIDEKYKIKDEKEMIDIKRKRFLSTDFNAMSAPAGFNRSQSIENFKKNSLAAEWGQKFDELSKKLEQKQYRVNMLSDKIFSLKNEFLYIRSIFIQLIKSLKIKATELSKKYKLTIDNHSREIINLLVNLFEYSQQEMNQIFGLGENLMEKTVKQKRRSNLDLSFVPSQKLKGIR